MSTRLATGLIAAFLVAAAVGVILFSTRKNAIQLNGQVLKVRTQMLDPVSTIAVIDFRLFNPSNQQFVVRDLGVKLQARSGAVVDGDVFSETEAAQMLAYYPILGGKYNQTLIIRDKINSGATVDRMVAVRFPETDENVQNRKSLLFVVTEIDGKTVEIYEHPKK